MKLHRVAHFIMPYREDTLLIRRRGFCFGFGGLCFGFGSFGFGFGGFGFGFGGLSGCLSRR